MKRILFLLPRLLCLAALAAAGAVRAETVTIAVAANMQPAFEALREAFSRQSGYGIDAIYGSSGKLFAQIGNGAPFDLFLSADMAYPLRLHAEGLARDPPQPYARGAIVLWTARPLDPGGWRDFLRSGAVKRIAAANPKTAPYGRETMKILECAGLLKDVEPKLVFGESIAQASQYLFSGVVDAGFTARAVVLSPPMRDRGHWLEMPGECYDLIEQGAVVLKHGTDRHAQASEAFFRFLFSPEARATLERYGYAVPAALPPQDR